MTFFFWGWRVGGFGRLGGLLYFVPLAVCVCPFGSEVLQRLVEMDESHCILENCGDD